ncbi:MAG: lamin tail domain-containing protein, partial [Planctomycetales bacterium]|nr:lamin tail domain-containing protein [Planctomycetales bacterium]
GEYVVFDESDFNSSLGANPTDFALDGAHGDQVFLWKTAGGQLDRIVDYVEFGAAANGESFGRVPDGGRGGFAPQLYSSLGKANSNPRIGPVVVSELNYNPGAPSAAALASNPNVTSSDLEFVEVHNPTSSSVSLSGWRVRGGVDYDFAATANLGAGATLVLVSFNPTAAANATLLAAFRAHYGIGSSVSLVGPFTGQLDNAGDRVVLQRPDEPPVDEPTFIPRLTIDEVRFDDESPWADADGSGNALQRTAPSSYGQFATAWIAESPSPGAVNYPGGLEGDFTGDGTVDGQDVDALAAAMRSATAASVYDLDGTNGVGFSDIVYLVENVIGSLMGDANLDGVVDATDFNTWNAHRFTANCASWSMGDFNGDGFMDVSDFNLWNAHKFQSAIGAVNSRPITPIAPAGLTTGLHVGLLDSLATPTAIISVDNALDLTGTRSRKGTQLAHSRVLEPEVIQEFARVAPDVIAGRPVRLSRYDNPARMSADSVDTAFADDWALGEAEWAGGVANSALARWFAG